MDGRTAAARAFPLALAGEGERVSIVSCADRRGVLKQLTDLGLPLGSLLTVVARQPRGPMVVARDGLRIALGHGITHRILVARAAVD